MLKSGISIINRPNRLSMRFLLAPSVIRCLIEGSCLYSLTCAYDWHRIKTVMRLYFAGVGEFCSPLSGCDFLQEPKLPLLAGR